VPEKFNIALDVCGRWAAERSRFALYYEDESGFTSAHTFWDIQREANRLANVLAALGTLPAIASRSSCRNARKRPLRMSRSTRWARWRYRCRISSARTRWNTGLAIRLRTSPSSMTASLPKVLALRDRLPQLRHVIGVGAAARRWRQGVGGSARARVTTLHAGAHRRRRRGDDHLHQRHDRQAEGALMAQRTLLGNLSGYVCSHDFFPTARRHVLVAGRLGVDRRPVGRAAADLALRHALARLQGPFRRRQGVRADREVRHSQQFPLSNCLEDDDEGRARADERSTISICAAS
jgi:acetyl-CoA synthetase